MSYILPSILYLISAVIFVVTVTPPFGDSKGARELLMASALFAIAGGVA